MGSPLSLRKMCLHSIDDDNDDGRPHTKPNSLSQNAVWSLDHIRMYNLLTEMSISPSPLGTNDVKFENFLEYQYCFRQENRVNGGM